MAAPPATATANPFDLLGDYDHDDPSAFIAAQQKKVAAPPPGAKKTLAPVQPSANSPAKLPPKPLSPAEAVRQAEEDGEVAGPVAAVDLAVDAADSTIGITTGAMRTGRSRMGSRGGLGRKKMERRRSFLVVGFGILIMVPEGAVPEVTLVVSQRRENGLPGGSSIVTVVLDVGQY